MLEQCFLCRVLLSLQSSFPSMTCMLCERERECTYIKYELVQMALYILPTLTRILSPCLVMRAIRNIPALVCCHANCGVSHFPANPHSIHGELEDIPAMDHIDSIIDSISPSTAVLGDTYTVVLSNYV